MTERIVVRVPNWIGDAVMAVPSLKTIKENMPESELWVCGISWVIELYRNFPFLDGIVQLKKGMNLGILKENAKIIKSFGFSKGFLFTNSFSTALEFFLSKIPERIGYSRDFRGFLLTKRVKWKKEKKHHVFYYLDILKEIGFKLGNPKIELYLEEEEKGWANRNLSKKGAKEGRINIGINPGAYYGEAKRWKTSGYGTLASLLKKKFDANIIIFGSKDETPIALEIKKFVGDSAIVLTGETTLRELMAYISQLDLFITNDSGPMHIANALGIPIVAIFGPTSPEVTSPFHQPYIIVKKDVSCTPCKYRSCPIGHICMAEISVEEVYSAVLKILEE